MTGNNNIRYLIGGLLMLLTAAVFYLIFSGFNWSTNYRQSGNEPYDTKLLYESLQAAKPVRILNEPANAALDSADTNTAYFFVGENNFMDSTDADALLRFVERGGRALIAAERRSLELNTVLFASQNDSMYYEDEDGELVWYPISKPFEEQFSDSVIWLNGLTENGPTEDVKIEFRYDDELYPYGWTYFLHDLEPDSGWTLQRIGRFNTNLCNVLQMNRGQGELYLLSTPLVLTNYHLRRAQVFDHVTPLFAQLNVSQVLWDKYNQTFHAEFDGKGKKGSFKADEGPLEFILRDRSLSWAWYILLGGTVLYFLAGARRKQRIIPLRDANVNTSVEFAETMSRLYWKHSDHRKIGLLKWQLFITFVRDRYGMRLNETQPLSNLTTVRLLAIKSGISETDLDILFNHAATLDAAEKADNAMLARLHASIEKFYANCK